MKTMKTAQTFGRYLRALAVFVLAMPLMAAPGAPPTRVRIIQTNSAGDRVSIIDPVTNTVVGEIKGIEVGHGATSSPDGTLIYISNEADTTLDVVDAQTLKVTKKIPLSGHPNNIAIGRDGRRVFVAIRNEPGGVDVVDTVSQEKIKSVRTKGPIHNPYVTPDGKYVLAGSIVGKSFELVSPTT